MAERKNKKLHIAIVAASLFLMLGIGLSFIGVVSARYQFSGVISTLYGEANNPSTVAETCKIYDFGCWKQGGADLQSTIVLQQADAIKGKLTFSFDGTTAQKKDIAVEVNSSFNSVVEVDEKDGRLDLPFSLIISAQQRSGVAYMNVEWTPEGAAKPTKSARYLIALNPDALCSGATSAPKFESSEGSLTSNVFHLSFVIPSSASGTYVAQGLNISSSFAKGTRYYNKTYPQGVTLIRNSVIYCPRTTSSAEEILIDRNGGTANPYKITIGSSYEHQSEISFSVKSQKDPLILSVSKEPIVNKNKPLTVTVSEPDGLKDSKWNDGQTSGAQLSWELQKLSNGVYSKIVQSENLKIAVTQNDDGGKFQISVPTGLQPAGTYQLVIKQSYNGFSFNLSTVRFFVDYR